MTIEHLIGVGWLAVAATAALCARLTRADRNYYPMQRVIWAALGFLGMGAGGTFLLGTSAAPTVRLLFVGVLLAATLYSIWFMRRRNRTPRYIILNLGGHDVPLDAEHLRRQSEDVTSLVHHGAAPEAWVAGLEAACAEWRRKDRWKREGLPGQLRARRAAKAGGER